jgi:hypothetical protein
VHVRKRLGKGDDRNCRTRIIVSDVIELCGLENAEEIKASMQLEEAFKTQDSVFILTEAATMLTASATVKSSMWLTGSG